MLEITKSSATGMLLGVLLLAGTTAQASAQATQDTTKGARTDTSAYSAPQPADTGVPSATQDTMKMQDTTMMKAGADTGMAGMSHDSMYSDTSKAGKKAWKKKGKKSADSTTAK